MSPGGRLGIAATVLVLLCASAALLRWQAARTPTHLELPDGAEAFFRGDSTVEPEAGYPTPRQIAVDGDIFFRVPASASPLILRSRLLVLTIEGKTAMRVTAYSREPGEQVEVLYGNVTARKNYPSTFQEPDHLSGGQMTMINRDIDLMEKESTDLAKLSAWSEALIAAVATERH
jgi:hypothetical protein